MISNCKQCNEEFKYFPSQKAGFFCSRTCSQNYRVKTIMESGEASKATAITYLKRFHDYKCGECGINEWNNKPISLQIEHKDGNPKNNTIDNIMWLCPNCHTQTETWGSKNASPEAKERMLEGLKTGWGRNERSALTTEQLDTMSRSSIG